MADANPTLSTPYRIRGDASAYRNILWGVVQKISRTDWPDSLWFNFWFALIFGFLYALVLLGPAVLNPSNISWLHGDPATYYIGWALFRQDPHLHWPLTYTDRIGYPIGDSIALMDVNPLLAVIFKGLSPLLPHPFQYLGIESVLACSLQLFFALRLFRLLLGPNVFTVLLPSVYLLVSPPMTLRLVGHYALTNQWLLTAALLVFCLAYLDRFISLKNFSVLILILGGISVSINPYLAFQVLVVLAATVITLQVRHRFTFPATAGVLTALCSISGLSAYAFGFIIPGNQGYGGSGYRLYSMNLISPFDPNGFGSTFVRQLPLFVREQSEGYCYLGAGVILLAIIIIATMLCRPFRIPRLEWRSAAPLLLCCLALTLMALSTRITFGSRLVLDLDPNERLTPFLAPLRSSGRLFWIPYYTLLTAILALPFFFFARSWATLLIAFALVVQVVDTMPLRRSVHLSLTRKSPLPSLRSPIWAKLGVTYTTIVVMPPYQCSPEASPGGENGADIFGMLAAEQHMRTNSYRSGRITGIAATFHCGESIAALTHRPFSLSPTSVYVVNPGFATIIASRGGRCHTLDSFIVCSAKDDFGLPPAHWESPTRFWVRNRFRIILNRDPADKEIDKWTQALDERILSPADFLLQLLTSADFDRYSIPAFWAYLDQQGRWPTFVEWKKDTHPSASITHHESVAHDRDRAIVEMLYFGILERDPDPIGLSGWSDALRSRTPLRDIINGFLNSVEYKAHGYDH